MTLCKLMQMDFLHDTGRYDEFGNELYSDTDLNFGEKYAVGYLNEGIKVDPVGGFDLCDFANWCRYKQRRDSEMDFEAEKELDFYFGLDGWGG